MATKSITITENAYRRLKQSKDGDESFSQVITRLTGNARAIRSLFGILSNEEADRLEERMKVNRKRWTELETKRREQLRRQLHGVS